MGSKSGEKNPVKYKLKANSDSERDEKLLQDLEAKLLRKSQSLRLVKKFMLNLIGKKNVLESELRRKNEEIYELNDKILALTSELAATKKDLEQALVEIKLLKEAVHDSERKNDIIKQRNTLFSRTQLEQVKSDILINQEIRETLALKNLESELWWKNEEIYELNNEILTLTRELAAIKIDLETALGDYSARKNEIIEQENTLFSRTQCELAKSSKLLSIDKNILESELRRKNEEIYKLNDENLTLTRELAATKKDLEKASEEIKQLKESVHDSTCKSEIIEQKNAFNRTQFELGKSDKLLNREIQKTLALENLKTKYADPHHCQILQKNYLEDCLLQSREGQLLQKSELLNKVLCEYVKNVLKRGPSSFIKDLGGQIVEYRKTIQNQKGKIKSLIAQINNFEAMLTDKYNELNK